jgi:hypothetical protein
VECHSFYTVFLIFFEALISNLSVILIGVWLIRRRDRVVVGHDFGEDWQVGVEQLPRGFEDHIDAVL